MQNFTYRTCVATASCSALKNPKANIESCACNLLFCIYLIHFLPQIPCFSSSISFVKYFEMPASQKVKKKRTLKEQRSNRIKSEWKTQLYSFAILKRVRTPGEGAKEHEMRSQHDINQSYEREMVLLRCSLITR